MNHCRKRATSSALTFYHDGLTARRSCSNVKCSPINSISCSTRASQSRSRAATTSSSSCPARQFRSFPNSNSPPSDRNFGRHSGQSMSARCAAWLSRELNSVSLIVTVNTRDKISNRLMLESNINSGTFTRICATNMRGAVFLDNGVFLQGLVSKVVIISAPLSQE